MATHSSAITELDPLHLPLLELLVGKGNVSQRRLAERMGLAVARVNRLIRELVDDGYLEVVDDEVRPFAYRLTSEGRSYHRRLSHRHYRSVVGSFRQIQRRIGERLSDLAGKGVRRVVYYGAGEVMEVAYPLAGEVGLRVVAVVDDDPERRGARLDGLEVECPSRIGDHCPDAVVITTFRHVDEIQERMGEMNVECPLVVEL